MLDVLAQLDRIEARMAEMDTKLDAIQESLYRIEFRQLDERDPYGLEGDAADGSA